MDQECVFCKIVGKKLPAYIVFEDENSMAFLDIDPLFKGDCLVIPKKHYETVMDTPDEIVRELFSNVKLVSTAVQKALKCDGILISFFELILTNFGVGLLIATILYRT